MKVHPIEIIKKITAEKFSISIEDMESDSKELKFVIPRNAAILISVNILPDMSAREVAPFFFRDQSTLNNSCLKMLYDMEANKKLKEVVDSLMEEVKRHFTHEAFSEIKPVKRWKPFLIYFNKFKTA